MRPLPEGRLAEAGRLIDARAGRGAQHGDPMNAQMRYASQISMLRREQGRLGEIVDLVLGIAGAMPAMPAFRAGAAMVAAETGREAGARAPFESLAARDFGGFPTDAAWAGAIARPLPLT